VNPFEVRRGRLIRPRQTPGHFCSECCQMRMTFQPSRRSRVLTSLSRSAFRPNLGRQHSRCVSGIKRHVGRACQKQPSTNTATPSCQKTKSGTPNILQCRRHPRMPFLRKSAASRCSVIAFLVLLIRDISRDLWDGTRLSLIAAQKTHAESKLEGIGADDIMQSVRAPRSLIPPNALALQESYSNQMTPLTGNRISLITGLALTKFAENAYVNAHRLRNMWVISPWLSRESAAQDPISLLCTAMKKSHCSVKVVTRQPESRWHSEALDRLWSAENTTVFFCSNLHAKLYILECDGYRSAIFGSPNLTARANRSNHELAIHCHTTLQDSTVDIVAALITSLCSYATSLISEDDVLLQNKHH
jgi:hypothetical protein